MYDADDRATRLVALWLDTYEGIAKTLRMLDDPIFLPPSPHEVGEVDRMIDAAATASAVLFDRSTEPTTLLANALLCWLSAQDVIVANLAGEAAWRPEAVLLMLRLAADQAAMAAVWLRQGPPMPPPPYGPN